MVMSAYVGARRCYHAIGVTTDCPDEDAIVAYAQGHLGDSARAEMAAHVDGCPICVALVAEAAREDGTRDEATRPDSEPLPTPSAPPDPEHGAAVGRYLVLEAVGRGGLGRVFAAYDPQLDRKVAIKLLDARAHRGLTPAQLRGRLLREAQALAKVRHPNVVAVHDVGVLGDPGDAHHAVFLTMELVDGGTLRQWLAEQPRSWQEIRDVFVAAARGLAAAHDANVVHRDVKPGNVLVGRDGRVQVADFGLARALDLDASSLPPSPSPSMPPIVTIDAGSLTGPTAGTPAYMAPEQHRGERVDARCDQFGLCVALFEALWSTRPFVGDTPEAVRAAVIAGKMVDPPAHGVPGWLRKVVQRGLASDPAERWPSMQALVAALQLDRPRRFSRAVAGAAGLVAGGAALWALVIAPALAPDDAETAAVEQLVVEARAAAAKACFAHPPFDAAEEPTAYAKVLALEATGGAAAELADERAAALREEFAATLVGLGDRYWELDEGRPFAAEYYAEALVFDDAHPQALARLGVSVAAMVALRERAAAGDFADDELVAVAPAQALATEDPELRSRRLEQTYAHTPEPPAALTAALQAVLDDPGRDAVARGRARKAAIAVATTRPEDSVAPNGIDDAARVPAPREATPARADPPAKATAAAHATEVAEVDAAKATDPQHARDEAKRGHAALRRGDLDAAAEAFHRALAANRSDITALAGLAEVSFQRRNYDAAASYLERAIAVAPRNSTLRIDLGDVYFKVLRYNDARTQYERARGLGHRDAAAKLSRLDARLGAAP